ncbi:hypothetical protein [Bradyrhizobium elkanii]|uniref:hypothetical protein n=1 Tax=Bradyrhizobium elkanii TaxID=29448 RepID=UPI0027146C0A|nr:hypothetical protein [Bradyrhizobium elkanii]WLB77009.1 hypothetical protein QIH83_21575 [Bradyrhizobium elkanii]
MPNVPLLTHDIRHVVQSMHGIRRSQAVAALKGLDLIEKAHRIYRSALAAGWSIDEDDWWWRQMRKGDKHFDECHFGFTTRDDVEDEAQNCVFVRCPTYALAYDRGEIIPQAKSHRAFRNLKFED